MILIPILAIIGYALLFSKLLKIKFTFILPSIASLLIVFLYFCTILEVLYYVTYFTYYIGIICLIGYLVLVNYQRSYQVLQKLPLTSKADSVVRQHLGEILALFLIILLFYLYTRNAYFSAWDDFSHWGVCSKELLHYNFFGQQYIHPSSIVKAHAHYPRGSAVYHYFMLLLPGYSEGNALFAHFLLHLIFLAPLMANKRFWQTIFLIFYLLVIVVLYTTGIRSVYNDSTIGLMFSSLFAIYILEKNKETAFLLMLPIIALLPLFREVGLWLATLASIILIFNHLKTNKENNRNRIFFLYFMLLLLPFLCSSFWMNYFKSTHDFFYRTQHSFTNVKLIAENFNEQHILVLLKYCQALGNFLIKEGSIGIYILCLLSWYGIYQYNRSLIQEYRFYLIATIICCIIFALWRLYLYFVAFTYDEAIRAASLLRYLGCYCLVFAVISSVYIKKTIYTVNIDKKVSFLLGLLFTVSLIVMGRSIARIPKQLPKPQKVFYQQSEVIRNLLANNLIVDINFENKRDALDCYKLNYRLAPYFAYESLLQCLDYPINFQAKQQELEFIEPIELKQLLENKHINTHYKILYKPFMNKLDFKI